MGRIGRVVAIGCLHHVTPSAATSGEVFLDDEDRLTYLALLGAAAAGAIACGSFGDSGCPASQAT
ncbi:MAG: hypothetical protein KIT83_19345 [Bryobacterales bacterium]|nr:hypothetical protein [Bryobacterales bacterium]